MDTEIISEEENPMLYRMDVQFEIVREEAVPFHLSVRDSFAAKLNKDSDEVVIHEFDAEFGIHKTASYTKVYENPEFARNAEQDYMLERNKITDAEVKVEET